MSSEWNSLEIAKLTVSLLTPIVVGCLGIYIHRVTKRFEHSQWTNQKVIEKRLSVYDSLAPQLNDILCYFTYVGCWKDCDPPAIIAMKREVDRNIYLAQPLFSPEFFKACSDFMSQCFETFTGWGNDAKLRSSFQRRRDAHRNWTPAWEACFSDKATDPNDIRRAYNRVMAVFAADIGLRGTPVSPAMSRIPENIR
jgi:hypothetical protein